MRPADPRTGPWSANRSPPTSVRRKPRSVGGARPGCAMARYKRLSRFINTLHIKSALVSAKAYARQTEVLC